MDISTVGIVGAGLMGAGIAEVSARNGLRTIVTEANADLLAAGQRRVDQSLQRGRAGGKLSDEDIEGITGLLHFTADLDEFRASDLCIEAIVEHLPEKKEVFQRLDTVAPPHAILATN